MKNSLIVFLVVSLIAAACSNERETVSGQKFTIVKNGDGKEVSGDKYLILNFMFKDGKDSIWNDSRKNPFPVVMQKKSIVKSGDLVLEVVGMLTKADSAIFKISAKDLFTKSFHQPIPRKVDSLSMFTFNIGLADALDSIQFIKFRDALVAKQNQKIQKQQEEQLSKDTVQIDSYLKEKKISALKTLSGLRYVITKQGKGEKAKEGQTVRVNYAGYVLNGKYFDTSVEAVAKKENIYQEGRKYSPYEVTVGRSSVIRGWHEALALMNQGSAMTFYIPSTLAYGTQKRGANIGENSILVFNMELIEIKK